MTLPMRMRKRSSPTRQSSPPRSSTASRRARPRNASAKASRRRSDRAAPGEAYDPRVDRRSPEIAMPSATRTITIRRSPEDVFAFVADGTTATQWRPGVTDIKLASGSGLGARYEQGVKGPGGRRVAADYEITAWAPPRELAFAAVAGPVRPTGAYRLEA